ncbi:MAG: hypothetical protein HYZ93_00325 [Candidatus Omnitrophica bacterium]|nr:hypothetical protein [Candidatus Omnitrophota bacterium]
MTRREVEEFFHELSREWKRPARILLIGGAGALMMGGSRPTSDVDFEVRILSRGDFWEEFSAKVREVSARTGIGAQFAESVDRWSQISFLDYRRQTRPLRKFGTIEVRLLEPAYWSIGKIGRYWDQDIQDMVAVFGEKRPFPLELARVWARALERSPRSTQLGLARRQALHFFRTYGRKIWGGSFRMEPVEEALAPRRPIG